MPADVYLQIARYVLGMGSIGRNAVGDAEALGVEPAHLPELVRRTPDSAQAFGTLARFGFRITDAHGDHFLVAPSTVD